MNNTFNLKRFGLLFKKHTIEHWRANLMSIAVLAGILFLVLGFSSMLDRNVTEGSQMITFATGILITGCIYTSMIFNTLSDKRKAIPELTLPVSHVERYLVAWVYTLPVFMVIFISIFYLSAGIAISIIPKRTGHELPHLINVFKVSEPAFAAFIGYIVLHGLAFWGAIFFKKLHYIKTAFVVFGALLILMFINYFLLAVMIGNDSLAGTAPFSNIHFRGTDEKFYSLGVNFDTALAGAGVFGVIVLLFWLSAFYRLKEKEV